MNSTYKQYKRKQKRENLTLVVQVTLTVIAFLLLADMACAVWWAVHPQNPPQDMWYLGEFTSNLIR